MLKTALALFALVTLAAGCSRAPEKTPDAPTAAQADVARRAAGTAPSIEQALLACASGFDEIARLAREADQLEAWERYQQGVSTRAADRFAGDVARGVLPASAVGVVGLSEEWRDTLATRVCGRLGADLAPAASGALGTQQPFMRRTPSALSPQQHAACVAQVVQFSQDLQGCVWRARNARVPAP